MNVKLKLNSSPNDSNSPWLCNRLVFLFNFRFRHKNLLFACKEVSLRTFTNVYAFIVSLPWKWIWDWKWSLIFTFAFWEVQKPKLSKERVSRLDSFGSFSSLCAYPLLGCGTLRGKLVTGYKPFKMWRFYFYLSIVQKWLIRTYQEQDDETEEAKNNRVIYHQISHILILNKDKPEMGLPSLGLLDRVVLFKSLKDVNLSGLSEFLSPQHCLIFGLGQFALLVWLCKKINLN